MAKPSFSIRWVSPLVAGGVAVAWSAVGIDYLARDEWEGISRVGHLVAATSLYTATGTLFGACAAGLIAAKRALSERLGRRAPALVPWIVPVSGALLSTLSLFSTAFWIFSGERVRGSHVATFGPWLVIGVAALVGAVGARVLVWIASLVDSRTTWAFFAIETALLAVAASLVRVDLTVYVSLYSRLHTALEATAAFLAFVAAALAASKLARKSALGDRVVERVALVSGIATSIFVLAEPVRSRTDEALRHAWREPVYVGRMLSRMQIVEGFVRDPRGWRGATMSSVVKLRERYDIATTTRSPAWDQPLVEPPWLAEKIAKIRGGRDYNVVVFYVDTLRADIARDPRIMPNTVRFASQALDFRRTYTTGSDTLHALPGILGGTYDLFAEQPNNLLRVARSAGYASTLVVAQSAHEFLGRLLPDFRLDQTLEIPDYAAGNENVWGYGADQPTAARIVDRGLDWLREHGRGQRFLLWLFNFDVHNWRELDEAYARQAGKQFGLLDENDPVWKYRVAARSVDNQLARLLDGLKEQGLDQDTIVLFVSDHGEGLGRDGFWVHSVFLWEDLVRVPLMLRIPGVPALEVREVVSLVDVAPTLARCMLKDAETTGYQGEDLLSYLVPDRPPRRLPLVLMSTLKEVPVRLGIVDPSAPWKLVLPLEGAVPELYDLRAKDPDGADLSPENPEEMLRLLNELVRGPLFPRLSEAGHGALDQAAAEGRTAILHEAKLAEAQKAAEAEKAAADATGQGTPGVVSAGVDGPPDAAAAPAAAGNPASSAARAASSGN